MTSQLKAPYRQVQIIGTLSNPKNMINLMIVMTHFKATDPSIGHVPTGDKCKNSFGRVALDDIMAL